MATATAGATEPQPARPAATTGEAVLQKPVTISGATARSRGNQKQRFTLLSVEQLMALPPPEWLIEGLLGDGALGVLYGPSGHGKTFVALDWALCVATGRDWLGHTVKRGPAVYIVAEGGRGVRNRVAAWKQHNEIDSIEQGYFVLEAIQLRNRDDLKLLVEGINGHNLKPSLIVLDTFARCFVGGDENTSKDVGEFVDACRRLHEQTGAALLLVHHTDKKGEQERGSSALRAGADAMFKVTKTQGGTIRIDNDKQKEDEPSATINVKLQPTAIDANSENKSCVVVPANGMTAGFVLSDPHRQAWTALQTCPDSTAVLQQWRAKYIERNGGAVPESTFRRWRDALIREGFVVLLERTGRSTRYQARNDSARMIATPVTATAAEPSLARRDHQPNSEVAATATPRRGGGVARGEA